MKKENLILLKELEEHFDFYSLRIMATSNDKKLFDFMLFNSQYKQEFEQKFFNKSEIGDRSVLLFKQNEFLKFLNCKKYGGSYTYFSNNIELFSGDKGLKSDGSVVLNFPFKDCVLKGGQSKDEQKIKEIFFNEILGRDEIDVLFSKKALCNFELIGKNLSSNICGGGGGCNTLLNALNPNAINSPCHSNTSPCHSEHSPCHSERSEESTKPQSKANVLLDSSASPRNDKKAQSPNFLIKGNNLLALHSLKHRKDIYGQVKLIYIDPPYNTRKKDDSFNYNDNFNHSTWLTFMKNRLEIAREFLREDGVIFVQCDDSEQAYLKVLMDEIFGRGNFVSTIIWRKIEENTSSGGTMKKIKTIRKDHEYILCYEKIQDNFITKKYMELPNFEGNYKNLDNDPRGDFKAGSISMKGDKNSSKYYEVTTPSGKKYARVWRVTQEEFKALNEDNRIYYGKNKDAVPQIKIFLNEERPVTPKSIFENLGSAFSAADDLNFLFEHTNTLPPQNDNAQPLFATPKPEALLKRIIEISTKEGDLIMDFFAGSGTTPAVAHKMKRRWIGIEQMDYVESITKERLKKVIAGEQGGVSKALNWQGGGSFVYLELMPLNAVYKEKISNLQVLKNRNAHHELNTCHSENFACHSNDTHHSNTPCHSSSPSCHSEYSPCHSERSEESINKNFDDLDSSASPQNDKDCKQNKTLDSTSTQEVRLDNTSTQEITLESIYKDLQEKAFIDYRVDIQTMLKDKEFEALSIEDKTKLLCSILDSNMDYVLYDDIEDSEYEISEDLIALNKAFYGANDE